MGINTFFQFSHWPDGNSCCSNISSCVYLAAAAISFYVYFGTGEIIMIFNTAFNVKYVWKYTRWHFKLNTQPLNMKERSCNVMISFLNITGQISLKHLTTYYHWVLAQCSIPIEIVLAYAQKFQTMHVYRFLFFYQVYFINW